MTERELQQLQQIARAQVWPSAQVTRAKQLLAIAEGSSYVKAAQAADRKSGDAVSHLVARFNQEDVASVIPVHAGGPSPLYGKDHIGISPHKALLPDVCCICRSGRGIFVRFFPPFQAWNVKRTVSNARCSDG